MRKIDTTRFNHPFCNVITTSNEGEPWLCTEANMHIEYGSYKGLIHFEEMP